jgi:hypothetical protein
MPAVNTRKKLIDYCLRSLGAPVLEINVDEEQIEDRVDDALRLFSEYSFDGAERVYLKYKVTSADIDRKYLLITGDRNMTESADGGGFDQSESEMAITETGQSGTVALEDLVLSVTKIFHITQQTVDMFDVRYQYALNDLYTFGTIDLVQYDLTQQYLSLLRQFLSPEKQVNFSRVTNKLKIDMDWKIVKPNQYFIIECYRLLDPRVYPEVYEDRMLKKYLTALIKKQWGVNLSKYNGVKLPGDIMLRGDEMMKEANAEIEAVEKELRDKYELPIDFMMG